MLPCRIACVRIGRFATGAASRRPGVGGSAGAASATAPPRPAGPPAEPPPAPPLALVTDLRGKPHVVALSREAQRRGAARGMALAEARALVADLLALPWDGEEIARAALEVTTALLAASPRVAWAGGTVHRSAGASMRPAGWEGEAGLWWVDAAGLGSEARLAQRLARLAGGLGFGRARVGVADSAIAAYAATFGRTDAREYGRTGVRRVRGAGSAGARPDSASAASSRRASPPPAPRRSARGAPHEPLVRPTIVPPGGDAAFLAPFPLALLEPDEDLTDTCHALGLGTMGQFAALDADEVESRFGPEGLALHRLARGLDTRGPSAPRDDTLPVVACDLGSPVATAEPLLFVLKGALTSLGVALRTRGLAAREISLALTLDDGSVAERAVRPARPTSHEAALFDHCRAAFDDWALPEPVTALAVRASVTVAASGEQGDLLAPRWADPSALDAAFERIRGREGADAVARPAQRDGHLPCDAGEWRMDGRADLRTAGRNTEGHQERGDAGRRPAPGVPSDGRSRPFPRGDVPAPVGESHRRRDAAPARPDEHDEQSEGVAPAGLATQRPLRIARGDRPAGWHRSNEAEPPREDGTSPVRLYARPLARPSEPPTAAALRLLAEPVPIRVRLGRAGLEAFRYGETWRDVTAWAGPERLVPRWWVSQDAPRDAAPVRKTPLTGLPSAGRTGAASAPAAGTSSPTPLTGPPRDYYSARTADGALWLVFRSAASRRWFVEGWWD